MSQSKNLDAGVIRSDLEMSDGRIIRYYDSTNRVREAKDLRETEVQPGIGELRLGQLLGVGAQGSAVRPPQDSAAVTKL